MQYEQQQQQPGRGKKQQYRVYQNWDKRLVKWHQALMIENILPQLEAEQISYWRGWVLINCTSICNTSGA